MFNSSANYTDPSGEIAATIAGTAIGAFSGILAGILHGDSVSGILNRAGAGAASGFMVGLGVDLAAATFGGASFVSAGLIGAGIGSAMSSGFLSKEGVSWSGFGTGAAVGALSGLAGAGVGALATRGVMAAGGQIAGQVAPRLVATVAGNMAGSAAGNATVQVTNMALGNQPRGFNWQQLGWATIGGAAGGAVSHGLTRGLTNATGHLAQGVSRWQYLLRSGLAGGAGGALGDAADQTAGLLSGTQQEWNWGRFAQSAAIGSVTSMAVARTQLNRACFAAGTPLLETETTSKAIEEFRSYEEFGNACDWLLTRDEHDANAPLVRRRVLRKFVRVSPILNLHAAGRIIETTAEHPFHVVARANGDDVLGWIPAHWLQSGDELLSHDGHRIVVEGVADSGRVTTVYNLEVEDCHTYFVGGSDWGFSVWAHNQCQPRDVTKAVEAIDKKAMIDKATAKQVAEAMRAGDKATAMKLLQGNVQGVGPKKAQMIVDHIETSLTQNPRTYQTYTKTHPDGTVYVGRASGRGTPRQNIARREGGGHDWSKKGYGPAELDQTTGNYAAIRGREQMLKDYYKRLGINVEADGGISPKNPNMQHYLDEARAVFGDL